MCKNEIFTLDKKARTFIQTNVPLVALCLMTFLANIHSLKTPLYAISSRALSQPCVQRLPITVTSLLYYYYYQYNSTLPVKYRKHFTPTCTCRYLTCSF